MMGVDVSTGTPLSIATSNRQIDTVLVQTTLPNAAVTANVIPKTADNNKEPVAKVQEPQKQTVKVEQDNIMASFEYDQHLKQVIITLKNNNTGEVVQQFPNEKVLRVLEGIMQSLQPVENVNTVDAKG
jgi:uncharacterized FlaG/YvyC family protein